MALGIGRTSSIKVRVIATLVAVGAFMLQPFVPLNLPSAFATTLTVTPSSQTIQAGQTKVSALSSIGSTSVNVSFSYDTKKLEAAPNPDSLVYGWRTVGGANNVLGTIVGLTGDTSDETGTITRTLPAGANNTSLEIYFTNTGTTNGASDEVYVTNLSATASAFPVAAPVITSPANNTTISSKTITFSWSPVSGAVSYEAEVGSNEGAKGAGVDNATQASFDMIDDGTYYVVVRAVNADGVAGPDSEKRFITISTQQPTPEQNAVCATGCEYTTIQSAVDSEASGSTITVKPGTYSENISINKPITLLGTDAVISGPNSGSGTVNIGNIDGVKIQGFSITHAADYSAIGGSGYGIGIVNGSKNIQILGNKIFNNRGGVYIQNPSTSGIVISGNDIYANKTGVQATGNLGNTIVSGNNIYANKTAGFVYYDDGTGTNLSNVTLSGNKFGFPGNDKSEIIVKQLTSSTTGVLKVSDNTFTDSPVTQSSDYANLNENTNLPASAYPTILTDASATAHVETIPVAPLAAPTLITPYDNTLTNDRDFAMKWLSVSGAAKYEYETSNTLNGNQLGTIIYRDDSTFSNYSETANVVTRGNSGTPDGDYYWHVRAIDAQGTPGAWSVIRKVTVDGSAPAVPTNLSLKTSGGSIVQNGGFTNSYGVVASWTGTSDVDHYVYKIWDTIPDNAYNGEANAYVVNVNGTSRAGDFNQGDGTYYIQIAAVDAAGNSSAFTNAFAVTYDSQKPVISTNVTENETLSGSKDISMSLIGEANPKIYNIRLLTQDNQPVKDSAGNNIGYYDANHSSTSANYTLDTTKLLNGTYKLQFSARDAAGNAADTLFRTVTIANSTTPTQPQAPARPVVTVNPAAPSGVVSGTVTNYPNVAFSILKIDGNDRNDLLGLIQVSATTNADGSNNYTLQLPSEYVAGSTHSINLRAKNTTINSDESVDINEFVTISATSGNGGNTGTGNGGTDTSVNPTDPTLDTPVSSIPTVSSGGASLTSTTSPSSSSTNTAQTGTSQTGDDSASVLGATDTNGSVLGTSDNNAQTDKVAAIAPSSDGWKLWGIPWYWIVGGVGVILGAWWLLAAQARSSQGA